MLKYLILQGKCGRVKTAERSARNGRRFALPNTEGNFRPGGGSMELALVVLILIAATGYIVAIKK